MAKPKSKSASTKPVGRGSPAKQDKKRAAPHAAPRAADAPEEPHRTRRSDDADAFLPDPSDDGPARSNDDLAEVLAEDFLESATRGNDVYEDDDLERPLPDEVGGPFVVTDADQELADDVDESNPADAEPAPRPTAVGGLARRPRAEARGGEDDDEGEDEEEEEEEDEDEVDLAENARRDDDRRRR
jgi:hypothetical protein